MRVLVHLYFPVRPGETPGGVQRIAADLLPPLAARPGLELTAVAAVGSDPGALPGVEIRPLLPVEPNWYPWETWAEEVAPTAALAAAEGFDAVWSLDRPLPAIPGVPRLLTLGTLSYTRPLTALAGRHFDGLAVPSAYLSGLAASVAGPELWEGEGPPIELIPNAVDAARLRPADPTALRARLGLPGDARCLVFPHRPSVLKGLAVARAALARLRAADPRFVLLIPREPEPHRPAAYDGVAGDGVIVHPWVGADDLPAYLSLGEASLSPSALPEGFGFAPVEAVACGTPAVSTRSGALGDLLPPGHGISFVAREDPDAVAAAVLAPPGPQELARGRAAIVARYGLDGAVEAYAGLLGRLRTVTGSFRPLRASAPALSRLG